MKKLNKKTIEELTTYLIKDTPLRNNSEGIRFALESCIGQTVQDIRKQIIDIFTWRFNTSSYDDINVLRSFIPNENNETITFTLECEDIKNIVCIPNDKYNTFDQEIIIQPLKPIKDQIRQRYTLTALKSTNRLRPNVIIDDMYPYAEWLSLNQSTNTQFVIIDETTIKNRFVTLSIPISKKYQIPRIPLLQLLESLGYSKKTLKSNLQKIKKRSLSLDFIGYGGMNLNLLENLGELAQEFNLSSVFKHISIYEPDKIEYHNLIRFNTNTLDKEVSLTGISLTDPVSVFTNHLSYTKANKSATYDFNVLSKLNLIDFSKVNRLSDTLPSYFEKVFDIEKPEISKEYKDEGRYSHILIGAPDIYTRLSITDKIQKLSQDSKISFLCITHQDNSINITKNPSVDNLELIVETYGKIELTKFFINIAKATAELIDILANKENLFERSIGEKLFNYTFDVKDIQTNKFVYDEEIFKTCEGGLIDTLS